MQLIVSSSSPRSSLSLLSFTVCASVGRPLGSLRSAQLPGLAVPTEISATFATWNTPRGVVNSKNSMFWPKKTRLKSTCCFWSNHQKNDPERKFEASNLYFKTWVQNQNGKTKSPILASHLCNTAWNFLNRFRRFLLIDGTKTKQNWRSPQSTCWQVAGPNSQAVPPAMPCLGSAGLRHARLWPGRWDVEMLASGGRNCYLGWSLIKQ